MIFAKIVLQINMWNIYKYTQEQCKDKKKQTVENGKIKILKIMHKKSIQILIEKFMNIPIIQVSFLNILKNSAVTKKMSVKIRKIFPIFLKII